MISDKYHHPHENINEIHLNLTKLKGKPFNGMFPPYPSMAPLSLENRIKLVATNGY